MLKNASHKGLYSGSLTIASGLAAAQVVGILFYPILSRIYSPAQFGVFSLFFLASQLLGVSLAARYEQAIILAKTKFESEAIFTIAILFSFCLSIFFLLFFIATFTILDDLLGTDLGFQWTFVSLGGLLVSITTSLSLLAVRNNTYLRVAINRLFKTILAISLQIAFGSGSAIARMGLIYGELLALLISALTLCLLSLKLFTYGHLSLLKKRKYRKYLVGLLSRYSAQPAWNLPHVLMNSLSGLLLIALIAALFSASQAGAYFLMHRILMMPAFLIVSSVSPIYFKAASERLKETGKFNDTLRLISAPIAIVALIIASIFFFFGVILFEFFLGNQWSLSGKLSQIMAPYAAVHLLLSSLGTTTLIAGKQRTMLLVGFGQNTLQLLSFFAGYRIYGGLEEALNFSVMLSIPYMLVILIWYWHLSQGDK